MTLVVQLLVSAVALWVASALVDGIRLGPASTTAEVLTLLAVALVFGIVNAVIKPVVNFFAFPFYILTLGLLIFVVNGCLLWLTGALSSELGLPFSVDGFWAGVWGGIVVSLVSFAANVLLPDWRR